MNRVVKTAVAVTAFGLAAAAMAVPAQAEVHHNTARYAFIDGPGGGTTASSPLGGVLGSLVNGGLLGTLLGQGKPKSAAHPEMTEAERDAAAENAARNAGQNSAEEAGGANAAEDVIRQGSPLPELSPIVGGIPFGGGGLPLLGAARMAQPGTPSVKTGKQGQTGTVAQSRTVDSAVGAMGGMLQSSVGGAMGKVSTASLLPDSGSGATTKTMNSTTKGVEALSTDTLFFGVTQATRRALPQSTSAELSPVIGQVAPAEMAPIAEALPGTSQVASLDELTPVIEDSSAFVASSGTNATGRYSDVVAALGWSTDALTSSVRGPWARD
ncbi:hypothetical protein [Nonomuraea sp. NPDC050643]|uniref:hypothetical protein n=1 Tax=Nonomuraea sp. NPDC050643 TaxID=3155660 RepID=UPI0033C9959B